MVCLLDRRESCGESACKRDSTWGAQAICGHSPGSLSTSTANQAPLQRPRALRAHTHTHAHTHRHSPARTHAHTCTRMCTHTQTHTRAQACAHTHTHTGTPLSSGFLLTPVLSLSPLLLQNSARERRWWADPMQPRRCLPLRGSCGCCFSRVTGLETGRMSRPHSEGS